MHMAELSGCCTDAPLDVRPAATSFSARFSAFVAPFPTVVLQVSMLLEAAIFHFWSFPLPMQTYPSSSKKLVDWNKMVFDLKEEEKSEVLDGEAGVQKLFCSIYEGASCSSTLDLMLCSTETDVALASKSRRC